MAPPSGGSCPSDGAGGPKSSQPWHRSCARPVSLAARSRSGCRMCRRTRLSSGRARLREANLDRRATGSSAVDLDLAAGLADDAKGHRELEAGPRIESSREEWVEQPLCDVG